MVISQHTRVALPAPAGPAYVLTHKPGAIS